MTTTAPRILSGPSAVPAPPLRRPAGHVERGLRPFPFPSLFGPVLAVDDEPDETPDADRAYEDGRIAGRAEAEVELVELRRRLDAAQAERDEALATVEAERIATAERADETARQLAGTWRDAVAALEPALVDLALSVADSLSAVPVGDEGRQAAFAAISEAVDTLAGSAPLSVHVHPVDLLYFQEAGLADAIEGTHPLLCWEPDDSVEAGDWKVSSPEAAVHRLRAPMLQALRERLGLAEVLS